MHRYTEEEIAKKAFELIDDGFLIGLTEENDLPEELNLQDRTILKVRTFLIDDIELDIQGEILERVHIVYDAEESTNHAIEYPTDYFKFDDINTITVDGLEWYRENLESLEDLEHLERCSFFALNYLKILIYVSVILYFLF